MPRILVVDDDPDILDLLSKALALPGYEVHLAPDPITGLDKARKLKPDLIVLDYHMPGTTGAHLFESFRRNQATASTPILFMSGEATAGQIRSEIAEDSHTRFLLKPAPIAELRRTVGEMLAGPAPAP